MKQTKVMYIRADRSCNLLDITEGAKMVYSSFESSYYMSITFALTCNLEKLEYGEQLDYTKLFSLLYI
jgi:hypothetical protein